MARILVFGDSIAWGAWDLEKGGWVNRLRLSLDEKNISDSDFYCTVYNLGISGDTSDDILRRFEFEAQQRLKEDVIFLIGVGINDSAWVHSKNDFLVSLDAFKENIRKLISLARKFSSKIIFIGLIGVDESKVDPIPWDPDKSYKNEYVKKYDDLLEKICNDENVYYIKLFGKIPKEFLEDGVHPNSEGHKMIFEIIKKFLVEHNIIII